MVNQPVSTGGLVWPEHLVSIVAEARERFGVPTLSVADRKTLPPETIVVDVRQPHEMAVSTIAGARRLESKSARQAFLREKPNAPVLVYCTAGWRSAEFTEDLVDAGVEAYNLEGGICAWVLHGNTVVDAGGEPTQRVHGYSAEWADCVPEGYEAVW